MKNPFFKKTNNVKFNDLLSLLNLKKQTINFIVNDIKELQTASKKDISFFNSIKYLDFLKKTKSRLVITDKKLRKLVPIKVIEVPNVLLAVSKIASLFYPDSLNDHLNTEINFLKKKIMKI